MHKISGGSLSLRIGEGKISVCLSGVSLLSAPEPLFVLRDHQGHEYVSSGFRERAIQEDHLLTLGYAYSDFEFEVRILSDEKGIRFSLFGRAYWQEEAPEPVTLNLPWLGALSLPGAEVRYPGNCVQKADGQTALQHKGMVYPPYSMIRADGVGLAVFFPLPAADLSWDSCRNQELCTAASPQAMSGHQLHLRLMGYPNLFFDAELRPLNNGWDECFALVKARVRADMDFSTLNRPDLKWIRECSLVHFAYAFGSEFLNPETQLPDMQRLLKQGEAFGGYDAVILWHEYPRLGVDERTQWDLFTDYPGGIAALREMAGQAHAAGTRIIIPFKPWDRSPLENDHQTAERIAKLIGSIDADGIFFDTMNTVPALLRQAVDRVKPGVVFMVESEPVTKASIEQVSCAWNQYHTDPSMPECNFLRFLVPEMQRFAIARWHTGRQKDMAVERAVFNGEGMVIWQDVFGCWLPYTQAQKAKVRAWKELHRKYGHIFRTVDAVPLLAVRSGMYANAFYHRDEALITLFNDTEQDIQGELMDVGPYSQAEEVRIGMDVRVSEGRLSGTLQPGRTALVYLKREGEA